MTRAAISVGLMCDPALKWLIFVDKEVNVYIQEFIAGRAPSDQFNVVGPLSMTDRKKLRDDPEAKVLAPVVTMNLRMDKNVNGPFVRVTASDDHVAMVQSWMLRAKHGPIAVNG